MNDPSIGINVESFSRIPNSAKEIYYLDAPLFGQCIFRLGKIDFEKWMNDTKFFTNKVKVPDLNRIIYSKIQEYPKELFDCKDTDLYEWRDIDGGGFTVNYFSKDEIVIYDWSSN